MLNSYVFHPLPPSPSPPHHHSFPLDSPRPHNAPIPFPTLFPTVSHLFLSASIPFPPPPSDSPPLPFLPSSRSLLPGAGCAGHQMCLSHHDMRVLSPSTLPPYSLEILAWEKLTFLRCLRGGGSATFSDSNAGPRPPHVRASRLLHRRRHIHAAFVPTQYIYNCARIGGPLAGRSPSSRWGVLVSRLSEGCPPTPSASRQFTAVSSLMATSPRGMSLYLSSRASGALTSLAVPRVPHRDAVLAYDRFLSFFDKNISHPFCTAAAF